MEGIGNGSLYPARSKLPLRSPQPDVLPRFEAELLPTDVVPADPVLTQIFHKLHVTRRSYAGRFLAQWKALGPWEPSRTQRVVEG